MTLLQRSPRSNRRSHRMFLRGALLAAAGFAAVSGQGAALDRAGPVAGAAASAFALQMETDMRKMMAAMHAPSYSGDPDADFLAMMIPHHQGAVDMARLALVHGRDPLTRRLAEDIVAAQTSEIAAMTARLHALRSGRGVEADDYPALGGHRGGNDGARQWPAAPGETGGAPGASHHH